MSYNQKDLLKFALDLFQKINKPGFSDSLNKDVLEVLKTINVSELPPSSLTGGEKKNQQEDENQLFWKQEASLPQNDASGPGQTKVENVSPVSIYETTRDVNLQAILPGIVSHEDLHLLISQEAIELYGARVPPGDNNPVDYFHKIIRLPATVEPSGATATYHNGLLALSVPKKKPDPPLRVSVKFE
ncbi:MAG: Hsp20 family protein [Desulfotomaculaceae bacterium]|nr:Hsp20 family protein [Desulfotomaculaceae bacterium]